MACRAWCAASRRGSAKRSAVRIHQPAAQLQGPDAAQHEIIGTNADGDAGITLSRATLSHYTGRSTELLRSIYVTQWHHVLQTKVPADLWRGGDLLYLVAQSG